VKKVERSAILSPPPPKNFLPLPRFSAPGEESRRDMTVRRVVKQKNLSLNTERNRRTYHQIQKERRTPVDNNIAAVPVMVIVVAGASLIGREMSIWSLIGREKNVDQ